jgi:hypothetical protein
METETGNNPIIRAKADLADLERKISVIRAEEERLAAERKDWEIDRNKIVSFIEMYQKYASPTSIKVETSGGGSPPQRPNGIDHAAEGVYAGKGSRNSRNRRPPVHKKPPGTPTTHEMILAALRDAEARGLRGLPPKDIANFIRQKWWPHLKSASVGPAAWRLYGENQLRKDGGLYMLPSP